MTCSFELAVPVLEDVLISASELVVRRDVAKRTVESDPVVVFDEVTDDTASFFDVLRCLVPEVFGLERAVPPFELAVALRIVGAGS